MGLFLGLCTPKPVVFYSFYPYPLPHFFISLNEREGFPVVNKDSRLSFCLDSASHSRFPRLFFFNFRSATSPPFWILPRRTVFLVIAGR